MEEKEIGPYIVERFLGQGATGKVLLARHKDDQNQKVAIKVIKKISFHDKKNLQAKVQREISLMRLIRHPNIINLIDVLESENNLYIILEYAEQGELFDYLIVNRFLCADVAIEFFRQIIFAIEYLHNHGICHRDLKPENILLDKSMRIKIADFGFARWVKSELLTDPCGSPHYAAPEVLSGKPYDGKAADVWSVGIILFALVAGYLPFEDDSPSRLKMKIQRGTFSMPEFNPAIKDILKKMLTVDPTKRITIPQIKEHQCFRWKIQEDYLLPRPLPAEYNDEDLSPEVLNAIDKVCSLSHDQFISELKSATNNLPKVIVAMLSSHLDLENLPWEKESNFSNIPKQLHDISIMFSNTNPNLSETTKLQNPQIDNDNFMKNETNELNHDFNVLNNGLNDQDPFHRHVITPMSPELKLNSKVSKPMWDFVDQLITEPIHETEVILNMKPNELANVMRVIQLAMNEMEQIMWFHPDPTRFYIRGKDNNSCFFSEIEAICEIDHMKIDFRLKKGDCDSFSVFCAKMCAELEIFYNQANTPKINE